MRMRKKKHGPERIAACGEYLLSDRDAIEEFMAEQPERFPCLLEIGCGKGDFALGMSAKTEGKAFLAMERDADVALLAMEKAKAAGIDPAGLRFLIQNARDLEALFRPGEIGAIYLNFSDPWPKKGYFKRRLTYRAFLDLYKSLLPPDGKIFFKTDNAGLFEFSLEEFKTAGFFLRNVTDDLHASPLNADNIETEYERNFSAKGFTIHYCEAYLDPAHPAPAHTPTEKELTAVDGAAD